MCETNAGGKRQVRLFLMMADAAPFDLRLTAPEVRTLAALSSYRNNKTGLAWPGTQRLARELGVGERAIQKHLRRLIEVGYLEERPHPWSARRRCGSRAFHVPLLARRSTNAC